MGTQNSSRGWYLHLLLDGISVVFAWYSVVFAFGGAAAVKCTNFRKDNGINKTPIDSWTGKDKDKAAMNLCRILQTGICRYR